MRLPLLILTICLLCGCADFINIVNAPAEPPLIRFTNNNISVAAGYSINTSVQLIDENNLASNLQITTASQSGHGITLTRTSPTTMDITGTVPQSPDVLAFFVPYTYTYNGESLSGKAHLTIRIIR